MHIFQTRNIRLCIGLNKFHHRRCEDYLRVIVKYLVVSQLDQTRTKHAHVICGYVEFTSWYSKNKIALFEM